MYNSNLNNILEALKKEYLSRVPEQKLVLLTKRYRAFEEVIVQFAIVNRRLNYAYLVCEIAIDTDKGCCFYGVSIINSTPTAIRNEIQMIQEACREVNKNL